jgi:hypothetical protein
MFLRRPLSQIVWGEQSLDLIWHRVTLADHRTCRQGCGPVGDLQFCRWRNIAIPTCRNDCCSLFTELPTFRQSMAATLRARSYLFAASVTGGCSSSRSIATESASFVCGALPVRPWLRFHAPLIEPDVQISRIRRSDKTSRLCFRVQRFPCVRVAATTPAQRLGVPLRSFTQPYQPSPKGLSGRPAHCPFSRLARRSLAMRPAHSRCHQFVTRYPKASASSLPPWPLRLLPAGAFAGWDLHRWKAPPYHGAHPQGTFAVAGEGQVAGPILFRLGNIGGYGGSARLLHVRYHAAVRHDLVLEAIFESHFCRELDQFGGPSFRHVFLFLVVQKTPDRPNAFARPYAQPYFKASICHFLNPAAR